MKKISLIIIALLLGIYLIVWARTNPYIIGAIGISYEDFKDYIEFEDGGDTLSVDSSTQITFTALTRDEDAYVYKDKGAAYFSGDFHFLVDIKVTAMATTPQVYFAGVANTVDDARTIQDSGTESELTCMVYYDGADYILYIREFDGSDAYNDSWTGPTQGTQYYLRFKRVEADGDHGTIYLGVYSTAQLQAAGDATDGDLDNLSVVLHTSKKDFRYIYAVQSYDTDTGQHTISGIISNLDLQE